MSIRKPQQSDLEDSDEALDDAMIEGEGAPNDSLKAELRERQKQMDHAIIMAGQLIAPVVEKDVPSGYDWVVDSLRSSNCNDLANDMEIAKALNCICLTREISRNRFDVGRYEAQRFREGYRNFEGIRKERSEDGGNSLYKSFFLVLFGT